MKEYIHLVPPLELINVLELSYSRIAHMIELDWGSTRLDKYLLDILSDSFKDDGAKRQGFPLEVFDALTKLQIINMNYLKSKGILSEKDEEDPNSRFGLDTWELPRNF